MWNPRDTVHGPQWTLQAPPDRSPRPQWLAGPAILPAGRTAARCQCGAAYALSAPLFQRPAQFFRPEADLADVLLDRLNGVADAQLAAFAGFLQDQIAPRVSH